MDAYNLVSADIDPTQPGFENWGGPGGLRNVKGEAITHKTPSSANLLIWWDNYFTRELFDRNYIDKWDWGKERTVRLFIAKGAAFNNRAKATPYLTADILVIGGKKLSVDQRITRNLEFIL